MHKPDITVSVWMPWRTAYWPQRVSIDEQVDLALALGVDAIALKGTNKNWVWGAKENFYNPVFKKNSNDAMEQATKAAGLEVDLWCFVNLRNPAAQARVIHEAVARWNPRNVKIDIEGTVAMGYIGNTGAFLRSLGVLYRHDGTRVKIWLQSYRRPDKHREKLDWLKFLTYTDHDGIHLLDGVAPQAYYIGTQHSVGDYTRMLEAYADLERQIGRRDLLWHITLPTFKEHGWYPSAQSLEWGIDFLRQELGERLVGVDFWRLGWLFEKTGREVKEMLIAYDWGRDEPPPDPDIPFEQRPEGERWQVVGGDLRQRGVVE